MFPLLHPPMDYLTTSDTSIMFSQPLPKMLSLSPYLEDLSDAISASSPLPVMITSVDSPYITSLNLSYSKPLISIYPNWDLDPSVHRRMTKYYYKKTLEKWLGNDMIKVLSYFTVSGNKVSLISSLSKYVSDSAYKDSDSDIAKKIEFIKDRFITKSKIYKILNKLVQTTGISWFDLPVHEYAVYRAIKHTLIKKIKKTIKNYRSR